MPCLKAEPDAKGRGTGLPEVGSLAECSGFPAQAVDSAPPATDQCSRWGVTMPDLNLTGYTTACVKPGEFPLLGWQRKFLRCFDRSGDAAVSVGRGGYTAVGTAVLAVVCARRTGVTL